MKKIFVFLFVATVVLAFTTESNGISVCGNISGVWDLAGSPYNVTCDVTVPAGQTLEIRPGVEVLFTGHYRFNVFGNLQAIGTEQDSIVFTRAFPTEESKWRGIYVLQGPDTCRFSHCVLEQFSSSVDHEGALYIDQSRPVIVNHSLFRYNRKEIGTGNPTGGAAILLMWSGWLKCSDCLFENNVSHGLGGAVFLGHLDLNTDVYFERCVFRNNSSEWRAGAVNVHGVRAHFTKCDFYGNSAAVYGGAVETQWSGLSYVSNCIAWNNSAPSYPTFATSNGSTFQVNYSDIQGGYAGTGNIDANPLFVNAPNGDFHLQAGSPCIDTGNPTSPLDPDGSRADMGAFPFTHPIPCPPITAIPFVDHFNSPTLDPCWQWHHTPPNPDQISLTDRPGWLQINCPRPPGFTEPGLFRYVLDGDMIIEMKVDLTIDGVPYLCVIIDDANQINIACGSGGFRTHSYTNGAPSFMDYPANPNTSHIRFVKTGTQYAVDISSNGVQWSHITTWNRNLAVNGMLMVGITAAGNSCEWDYFRIGTLADSVLGVELTSFSAIPASDAIRLFFTTASETDNARFEIWRGGSADGEFAKLVDLPSQGNSSTEHRYEFTDTDVNTGQSYWYYLADVDLQGNRTEHRERMASATVQDAAMPVEYALSAYPNPFNPTTTIGYDLAQAGQVTLAVYNLVGQHVVTLVNETMNAGRHSVAFDATGLPSGMYVCRIEAGGFSAMQKMVLMK